MLIALVFGMVFPLLNFSPTQAARVKLQITWQTYWCADSYDADNVGEFYLQFKYYNDIYYIEKTSQVKVSPSPPGTPATPSLTYTLKKDFVLGQNLYVRLLESDFWNPDDLIISPLMIDHGNKDSLFWNGIYISTSFSYGTYTLSNGLGDEITIFIINLG